MQLTKRTLSVEDDMDKHIALVLITAIAIASSLLGNFAQANDVLTELKNYSNTHTAEQSIVYLNQFDLDNSDFSAEEKAKFYFQYGQLFEQTRQLDLSIASYDKGISYVEALPVTDILIDSYLERSFANYLKTNDPAVYCIDRVKALNYARQHSNLELLTKTLTQNAFCYENANNFHIGIALLDEALEIVDTSHLHLELAVFGKDILKIKVDQKIKFTVPEGLRCSGALLPYWGPIVNEISEIGMPGVFSDLVKADIENGKSIITVIGDLKALRYRVEMLESK